MSNWSPGIPKKISKIEGQPFNNDGWGSDDDDDALINQADLIETQALSQKQLSVPSFNHNGTTTTSTYNGSTNSDNVRQISSKNSVQNKNSWHTSSLSNIKFCPESLIYASHVKLGNDLKLKEEIENLKDTVKGLKESKLKVELELSSARAENQILNKQVEGDELRIQLNLKAIKNLESQLSFKKQEVTSIQWNQTQQTSTPKPNRPTVVFPKSNNNFVDLTRSSEVVNNGSRFPTTSSFSKCLTNVFADASTSTSENELQKRNEVDNEHSVLPNKYKNVETLLMKLLIQQMDSFSTAASSGDQDKVSFNALRLKSAFSNIFSQANEITVHDESNVLSQFNLKNDCGEAFLRFIEERLVLPSGSTLDDSTEISCDDTVSSIILWHQLLKILNYLIHCSSQVRSCILLETYFDATLSWRNALGLSVDQNEVPKENCDILKTLFTFFNPAIPTLIDDANYTKLTQEILRIFTGLAVNSAPEIISKFLPFFNLNMIKICKLHFIDSGVFTSFVRFFTSVCASTEIVKATCNDDICLWVVLADGWNEAALHFSAHELAQLDLEMCRLLSMCLSHELVRPPFIDADDCHCPFDVGNSLVQCVYRYKRSQESSGEIENVFQLQLAIEVLLHLSLRDPCIDDHLNRVKSEYTSFLTWLNRMHKKENLGVSAEGFLVLCLDLYLPFK